MTLYSGHITSDHDSETQLTTVGAVFVNYNAGAYVLDAVASARREGIKEIVVVDNGSTDGSAELIESADPDACLIRLPNPGLGAGTNAGVAALDTDIVFCINPDTVIHEGAVDVLRDALNADPDIACVGPRLLNPDGSLYPSAREFPVLANSVGHGLFGMIWPNNPWSRRYKRLDSDYGSRHEVDWLSGAALFARRSAFNAIGGFDEAYFMYMEDVDFGWRMKQHRWKMVYVPEATLTHVGGVSTSQTPYRMLREHHRSAVRYNIRTARGFDRLLLPLLITALYARLPLSWLHHYVARRKA